MSGPDYFAMEHGSSGITCALLYNPEIATKHPFCEVYKAIELYEKCGDEFYVKMSAERSM